MIRLNKLQQVEYWIDSWLNMTKYVSCLYPLLTHSLERFFDHSVGEIHINVI